MPGPEAERIELSVVVPAFNSAGQVQDAVDTLLRGLAPHAGPVEIVVVDDGSTDGTGEAARRAAAADPRVVAVSLDRNRGKGAAVARGMVTARGRVRAFTDVDVPYGTDCILRMREAIAGGRFDVAVGDRDLPGSAYHSQIGLARRLASRAFTALVLLLAPSDSGDTQCGVKAFDGEVAAHLFPLLRETGFAFDAEALYLCRKFRLRVERLPVRLERSGPSSVSITKVALPMLRSVAGLRLRWRRGLYRDEWLGAHGAARSAARRAESAP